MEDPAEEPHVSEEEQRQRDWDCYIGRPTRRPEYGGRGVRKLILEQTLCPDPDSQK